MEIFLRQIYPWMIYVSSMSVLLPFLVSLFLLRKQKGPQFRLLFLFVLLWLVNESLSHLTVYLGTTNNMWSNHLFTPIEFAVLSAIFYFSFEEKLTRNLIIAAVVAMGVASWYDAITLGGINQMNSMPKMLANTLLITMTLAYFYKVANNQKTLYLDKDPIFLLSCGLLIYLAGTSMSYAMFNQALAISYDAARICITVILVLNIMFNISLSFIFRRMAA